MGEDEPSLDAETLAKILSRLRERKSELDQPDLDLTRAEERSRLIDDVLSGGSPGLSDYLASLGVVPSRLSGAERDELIALVDQLVVDPRGYERGVALTIGVNRLDPVRYPQVSPLASCENDANEFARYFRDMGFDIVFTLLTDAATKETAVEAIRSYARELKAGDLFVLTFSGSGTQVPIGPAPAGEDRAGRERPEPDRTNEALLFFDSMLLDDELVRLLAEFQPGTHLVLVIDTSHADLFGQEEFEAVLNESPGADILLLAGCREDQFAMDNGKNGAFTGVLLQALRDLPDLGNYRALMAYAGDQMRRQMPDSGQTPQLRLIGEEAEALALRYPFRVRTTEGPDGGGEQDDPS